MILKNSPSTQTQCTHCGLPVPIGLLNENREQQFCCAGCDTAWHLIRANGLEAFYQMAMPSTRPVFATEREIADNTFADFDESVFQQKFVRRQQSGHAKIELALEGIHCAACIWLIEKLPSILPGVQEANVHWGRRTVVVTWQPETVPLSQIALTLKQLGYPPTPLLQNSKRDRWKAENRMHLTRIGVAAACAGNNMVISAAIYLGTYAYMTTSMLQMLRVASAIVGVVALLWPGRTFLTSALASIRTRTPHMDLPIALALGVGTTAGIVNVIVGTGEIYFDSLSVLICLLLVGRWFQFRQQAKAANSVELLHQLTPQKARKLVDGQPVEVLADLLQPGDSIEVRCGDLLPADGTIDSQTQIDEAILTGESSPAHKYRGDPVWAGTTNVGSTVHVKVNHLGVATRIGGIVDLVEQASNRRPQIVQWANRIGGYFVIAVILLATFTFAWWMSSNLNVAIDRSIALLIVACPCALALATPLAIAVALGRAAKGRIMIKSGDVLQSLQKPGMIWLDKTGTITDGDLQVNRWHGSQRSLSIVAALESISSHPVARAICKFGKLQRNTGINSQACPVTDRLPDLQGVNHYPGLGIAGIVDGLEIVVGSRQLLQQLGIDVSRRQNRIEQEIFDRGGSSCWVAVDQKVVAIVELMDRIRPEAATAIDFLKENGWRVGILSGDHQQVVDRVAHRLHINSEFAIGGATPEQKLAIVESGARLAAGPRCVGFDSNKSVVMVGDGVNDSAALAAATVGVAVKECAEASLSAAPVYFAELGLNPMIRLLELSRSTSKTMRLNLAVSIAYNLGFAALAFLGHISPLVAAILMPISSITVVAISLTAGRRKKESL